MARGLYLSQAFYHHLTEVVTDPDLAAALGTARIVPSGYAVIDDHDARTVIETTFPVVLPALIEGWVAEGTHRSKSRARIAVTLLKAVCNIDHAVEGIEVKTGSLAWLGVTDPTTRVKPGELVSDPTADLDGWPEHRGLTFADLWDADLVVQILQGIVRHDGEDWAPAVERWGGVDKMANAYGLPWEAEYRKRVARRRQAEYAAR